MLSPRKNYFLYLVLFTLLRWRQGSCITLTCCRPQTDISPPRCNQRRYKYSLRCHQGRDISFFCRNRLRYISFQCYNRARFMVSQSWNKKECPFSRCCNEGRRTSSQRSNRGARNSLPQPVVSYASACLHFFFLPSKSGRILPPIHKDNKLSAATAAAETATAAAETATAALPPSPAAAEGLLASTEAAATRYSARERAAALSAGESGAESAAAASAAESAVPVAESAAAAAESAAAAGSRVHARGNVAATGAAELPGTRTLEATRLQQSLRMTAAAAAARRLLLPRSPPVQRGRVIGSKPHAETLAWACMTGFCGRKANERGRPDLLAAPAKSSTLRCPSIHRRGSLLNRHQAKIATCTCMTRGKWRRGEERQGGQLLLAVVRSFFTTPAAAAEYCEGERGPGYQAAAAATAARGSRCCGSCLATADPAGRTTTAQSRGRAEVPILAHESVKISKATKTATAAVAAAVAAATVAARRFTAAAHPAAGAVFTQAEWTDKEVAKMDEETKESVNATKRPTIGTHSGTFHADEVLATVMLLSLPEYKNAKLLRSREPAALAACQIVVDVGGEYSPAARRFDHHQKGFNTTFYDEGNEADKGDARLEVLPAANAAAVTAADAPASPAAATPGEAAAAPAAAVGAEGAAPAAATAAAAPASSQAGTEGVTRTEKGGPGGAGGKEADEQEGREGTGRERKRGRGDGEGDKTLVYTTNEKGTEPAKEAPAAPKARAVTKLSSAGLVYKHFGRRLLQHRYGIRDDSTLETVYQRLYRTFVEAIDAIDNGVSVVPGGGSVAFRDSTNLSSRISQCNPPWNGSVLQQKYPEDPLYHPEKAPLYPVEIEGNDSPEKNNGFRKAMLLAADALDAAARAIIDVWLPARGIVAAAIKDRFAVHPSGRMIRLQQWCPFEDHIYMLEKETDINPPLLYCLYPDLKDGANAVGWRIRAIGIEGHMMESRLPLSSRFRGLRGSELGAGVCGEEHIANEKTIKPEDFIHCHATGFIAGTTTLVRHHTRLSYHAALRGSTKRIISAEPDDLVVMRRPRQRQRNMAGKGKLAHSCPGPRLYAHHVARLCNRVDRCARPIYIRA